MDTDGSDQEILYSPNDRSIIAPSYSPDGEYVVFSSYAFNMDSDVCVIDKDGENLKTLVKNTAEDHHAVWQHRKAGVPVDESSVDVDSVSNAGDESAVPDTAGQYAAADLKYDAVAMPVMNSGNRRALRVAK